MSLEAMIWEFYLRKPSDAGYYFPIASVWDVNAWHRHMYFMILSSDRANRA